MLEYLLLGAGWVLTGVWALIRMNRLEPVDSVTILGGVLCGPITWIIYAIGRSFNG